MAGTTPIQHVVIIVKENHTFDNYFGSFPGADGDPGQPVSPNPPPRDPDHRHAAWLARAAGAVRTQFREADIPVYWDYARRYTLCERYYTDVAGPSTPNHLMSVAADSPVIDNPGGHPVYDLPSLPAQLEAAGLAWANYGGYVFDLIRSTSGRALPSSQFLTDAGAGRLPAVSWLYAPGALSEHPADTAAQHAAGYGDVTKGSQWTADQVRALVRGGLWPATAIFVTWDDWGGWYDHVDPPLVEKWQDGTQFRYGSRVPCLVLSPFARPGHLSSATLSHVSLVAFCEKIFGLPSLNERTRTADPMTDCFDFGQTPLAPPG